jgi:hypothetical protein
LVDNDNGGDFVSILMKELMKEIDERIDERN